MKNTASSANSAANSAAHSALSVARNLARKSLVAVYVDQVRGAVIDLKPLSRGTRVLTLIGYASVGVLLVVSQSPVEPA